MDRLERDLYLIEEDRRGNRRVHVLAFAYNADDGTATPYRLVEFNFFYVPLGTTEDEFWKTYENNLMCCKQDISDFDDAGLVAALDDYFAVPHTVLAYGDITPDTPCGHYIQPMD